MENYFERAVSRMKNFILPMQRQIYDKCGCFRSDMVASF